MKKTIFILALAGLSMLISTYSYGQNYSGQWLGTVTESVNNCARLGKAEPGDYILTIIHKNQDFTVMDNVVQRPYTGVINPAQPKTVHVQGNYVDDGGYVHEIVDIEFTNENEGGGESSWRWSGGFYECGGHFSFTLKKLGS